MFSQYENNKNKINLIGELPIEMIKSPIKFLDKPSEYAYISSCRLFHSLGKFDYYGAMLLHYVAEGDQKSVHAMLLEYPALLSYKGKVIDKAGRIFNSITPLQYAAWALDKYMWDLLTAFMPGETAAHQLEALQRYGTEHGFHYDFTILLNALENFINQFDTVSIEEGKRLWANVGHAQQNLPAHVVHEYCNLAKSFYNIPTFDAENLSRTSEFLNVLTDLNNDWFKDSKCLQNYAITRGWQGCAKLVEARDASCNQGAQYGSAAADLLAMKALFVARMQNREDLAELLKVSQKNQNK